MEIYIIGPVGSGKGVVAKHLFSLLSQEKFVTHRNFNERERFELGEQYLIDRVAIYEGTAREFKQMKGKGD